MTHFESTALYPTPLSTMTDYSEIYDIPENEYSVFLPDPSLVRSIDKASISFGSADDSYLYQQAFSILVSRDFNLFKNKLKYRFALGGGLAIRRVQMKTYGFMDTLRPVDGFFGQQYTYVEMYMKAKYTSMLLNIKNSVVYNLNNRWNAILDFTYSPVYGPRFRLYENGFYLSAGLEGSIW